MSESREHKRHSTHEHFEEEGEPWLVSYADLMTLLFGFFVLMYSFASAKLDDSSEDWVKVKKEVSAYFGGSFSPSKPDPNGKESNFKTQETEGKSYRENSAIELINKNTKLSKSTDVDQKFELEQLEKLQNSLSALEIRNMRQELEKKLTPDQMTNSTKNEKPITGFEIGFSGHRIFTKGQNFVTLSLEGKNLLKKLVVQLLAFKVPLKIDIESYQDIQFAPVPITPAAKKAAFERTSQRATAILETISEELPSKERETFSFSASGMGYLKNQDKALSGLEERVMIKITLDKKVKTR